MADLNLRFISGRIASIFTRNALVQTTTDQLREQLEVDRVVLYYFYPDWKGQVTYESAASRELSILGSTGPDNCFAEEYAQLYLAGRIQAIVDIQTEPLADCHRAFLHSLQVRSSLVAPVVTSKGLWGLLIAHQCRSTRQWTPDDIEAIRQAAEALAKIPAIRGH